MTVLVFYWPEKDPLEILDYQIDWTARLGPGDSVVSSSWTIGPDAMLVPGSSSRTETSTTIWLSGGALGTTYQVMNSVTTAGGRTMDQTVLLKITAK
jgi:hypothetical protein